jgi:uncharacterized coiled-coil protein SlyX
MMDEQRIDELEARLTAARAAGFRMAAEVQRINEAVDNHEELLQDVRKALQGIVDTIRGLTAMVEQSKRDETPAPAALPKGRMVN